jgi:hypothetical protein
MVVRRVAGATFGFGVAFAFEGFVIFLTGGDLIFVG